MSLFVKEAQPPPGCGRHKWPDSHGPADNRRPCAGLFPSGAVTTRTSGGREKGSGTSSLSEPVLLTTCSFGRCCPSRLPDACLPSRWGGASLGWFCRCGTGSAAPMPGARLLPLAKLGRGAQGGHLKVAPEGEDRPLMHDFAEVPPSCPPSGALQ